MILCSSSPVHPPLAKNAEAKSETEHRAQDGLCLLCGNTIEGSLSEEGKSL
jgi:hypothetical protein